MAPEHQLGAIVSVTELHPFHVRMPQELRKAVEKEAKINGRSVNSEILSRLKQSFEKRGGMFSIARQEATPYQGSADLSDPERQILNIFRDMPPTKQLALISLFK